MFKKIRLTSLYEFDVQPSPGFLTESNADMQICNSLCLKDAIYYTPADSRSFDREKSAPAHWLDKR